MYTWEIVVLISTNIFDCFVFNFRFCSFKIKFPFFLNNMIAVLLLLLLSGICNFFFLISSSECFLNRCLAKCPTSSKHIGQKSFVILFVKLPAVLCISTGKLVCKVVDYVLICRSAVHSGGPWNIYRVSTFFVLNFGKV